MIDLFCELGDPGMSSSPRTFSQPSSGKAPPSWQTHVHVGRKQRACEAYQQRDYYVGPSK